MPQSIARLKPLDVLHIWRRTAIAAGTATLVASACDAPTEESSRLISLSANSTFFADTVPDCSSCSLLLREAGSFGAAQDSVLLRGIPMVARDGAGNVYAAVPRAHDHEILKFASDGTLAGTIGAYGTGPGEYRYVVSLTLYRDSILTVAHDDRYITEFTREGQHVVTRAISPRVTGPVVKRPGSGYVMTGRIRSTTGEEHAIHFVSDAGTVERSAGTDDVLSPNGSRLRAVSAVDSDGFWVSEIGTYRLERIDRSGRVARTIGVEAPPSFFSKTFMSREEAEAARSSARARRDVATEFAARPQRHPVPPALRITSVSMLNGHLVVVANVAAADWAEVELMYRQGNEIQLDSSALPHLYETVVDVIDPLSGALLARQRVPGYGSLADVDVLATIHADEHGVLTGRLYQLEFRRPNR
jgi:hypothetical protein